VARLVELGLVETEPLPSGDIEYRITDAGRAAATAQTRISRSESSSGTKFPFAHLVEQIPPSGMIPQRWAAVSQQHVNRRVL
jgi:hypothetical protein